MPATRISDGTPGPAAGSDVIPVGTGSGKTTRTVDAVVSYASTAAPIVSLFNASITQLLIDKTDSYTFILSDFDTPSILRLTKTGAATVTVPPNASVGVTIGRAIGILKVGTGDITYSPGAGVTIIPGSGAYTSTTNQLVFLVKTDTNTWILVNGIAIDAAALGLVPNTRQVAGFALNADISLLSLMAAMGVPRVTILANDVVNNNATPDTLADVTGLSFAVTSGKTYKFRFRICYTSAASTTGSRWTINGPTFTFLQYDVNWDLTANTASLARALVAYDGGAVNATTQTASGAVAEAYIIGVIKPSADGTVIARFSSEVTSSAITAKKDMSYVEYAELTAL